MKEKRRFERYPDSLEMDITASTGDIRTYTTLDISDGGIFVLVVPGEQLTVLKSLSYRRSTHKKIKKPTMRGRVARRSGQGMGIEFLDLSFS